MFERLTGVETVKELDDFPRLPATLLQKLKRVAARAPCCV
jgi:hypothetical protein